MKDNKKQIEELAKVIETTNFCAVNCANCEFKAFSNCKSTLIASVILKHYQVVDQDAVVLSKEDYEFLNIAKKIWASDGEEVKASELIESFKVIDKQACKETAENIVHLLADYKEYDYKSCSYKDWCVPHTIIKHIAQSVGIDIRTLNDKPTKKSLKFNGVVIKE